jgi:hypothetical protein
VHPLLVALDRPSVDAADIATSTDVGDVLGCRTPTVAARRVILGSMVRSRFTVHAISITHPQGFVK